MDPGGMLRSFPIIDNAGDEIDDATGLNPPGKYPD